MKKICKGLLSFLMVLSVSACSTNNNESTPSVEPVAEKVKNKPVTLEETKEERPVVTENYEELYKQELDKNDILNKEIEQLRKANEQYLEKLNKLKTRYGKSLKDLL